ncbi:MAG: N-acetylmuramoyl-L-alanine amidase [Bacteroidia bacterium]
MKFLIILILSVLATLTLQAQIIIIDPGHGYDASGGNPDGRTATEINTALEVGLRLQTLLNNECTNYTTYMTRSTANGWISVSQRASMSNSWNGDYYLSIHGNAGGGTGTETFWCTNNDATSTDDISLATQIQSQMVTHGAWTNRRCVEDASYIFHLGVLSGSNATGCLNEIGFVDTPADALKLNSTAWRDSFALAYKNAIKIVAGGCSSTPAATNDYCVNAQTLASNTTCTTTAGTLNGSTATFTTKATCDVFGGTPAQNDVFYSFTANNTTHTITVNPVGTTVDAVDAVVALYSGTSCLSSTEIACAGGTGGAGGVTKTLVANNLTAGQTYWIRIYDYGTVAPLDPNFEICVTSTTITNLGTLSSEIINTVSIFPNPSNAIFTIQGAQKISNISVYNTVGQLVLNTINDNNTAQIDLSNNAKGIYFVQLQIDNNTITKKIILE